MPAGRVAFFCFGELALNEALQRAAESWGGIPSLWREVQAAMERAEVDDPIPQLPPTYAEWSRATSQVVPADPDE